MATMTLLGELLALCVCLVCHAQSVTRPSTIVFQNNQFTNVVVAIHDSIAEDKTLIDTLKDRMTKASQILYQATQQRAYFKEIVILLPSSWSNEPSYGSATTESIYQADVLITNNFRKKRSVQTRAYKGCGQQGVHVLLNREFLTTPRTKPYFNSPEKYFVHAFAQFRWGVYQEYGEVGESPFYISLNSGRPEAIRCVYNMRGLIKKNDANKTICYTAIDQNTGLYEDGCNWLPYPYHQRIKASMMDYQFIQEIETFCDDNATNTLTVHNYEAPNKHNRLCDHRSVWDIIQNTADFTGGINSAVTVTGQQLVPTFRVIKATARKRRAVIAVDRSIIKREGIRQAMRQIGRMKREADRYSTPLSLVYVKNGMIRDHPVDTLDDLDVFRSALASKSIRLPTCHQMLQMKNEDENVKTFCSRHSYGAHSGLMTYGRTAGQTFLDKLRHSVFADQTSRQYHTVIKREDYALDAGVGVTGTFHVDVTLKPSIHVVFHYQHALPDVTLIAPSGRSLDVQHADVHELLKEIAFTCQTEPGEWSYNIVSRDNQTVSMATTANIEEVDNMEIKLDMDKPEVGFPYFRLFIDVTQFHHPIIGLNVTATLETPTGARHNIQLLDNGAGADTSKDDGVYSRVCTDVREFGHYHVTVSIAGQHGHVYRKEEFFDELDEDVFDEIDEDDVDMYTPDDHGLRHLQKYVELSKLDGNIQRHIGGHSIYNDNRDVILQGGHDVIPPFKVTDLSVQKHVLHRNQFVLKFTAPGDDLDKGKVSAYEVFVGENIRSADIQQFISYTQSSLYKGQGHVWKMVYNSTVVAMETEQIIYKNPPTKSTQTMVFGVLGIDNSGNKGKISNIVTMRTSV